MIYYGKVYFSKGYLEVLERYLSRDGVSHCDPRDKLVRTTREKYKIPVCYFLREIRLSRNEAQNRKTRGSRSTSILRLKVEREDKEDKLWQRVLSVVSKKRKPYRSIPGWFDPGIWLARRHDWLFMFMFHFDLKYTHSASLSLTFISASSGTGSEIGLIADYMLSFVLLRPCVLALDPALDSS